MTEDLPKNWVLANSKLPRKKINGKLQSAVQAAMQGISLRPQGLHRIEIGSMTGWQYSGQKTNDSRQCLGIECV